MKRLALFTLLATAPLMFGFRLFWQPVTTYTDGAPITGPAVMYDAWMDDTQIASRTTELSAPLADNTFGATHTYKVRTRLSDGRVSEYKVATLKSPLDQRSPAPPGALSIGE